MSESPLPAGATLTIDLDALVANWRSLGERAGAEAGAVVKADAYGIGIEPAVKALAAAGCRTFFVAHLSEGVRARAVAPDATVYVLNGLLPGMAGAMIEHRLSPVLGSAEEFAEWSAARRQSPDAPKAALHVDTGMNRLGLPFEEGFALDRATIDAAGIGLLMSHFSASEVPGDPSNTRQIEAFAALSAAFPHLPASLKNSSGHFLPGCPSYALTRPGVALYGANPTPGRPNPMRPVVELDAAIVQVREVEAGTAVGYNGRWVAKRRSRLATISFGYADGYPRNSGGIDGQPPGGFALVGGIECPFVGTVSMDLVIVDVTDAPTARRGDRVTLIGGVLDLDRVGAGARTIAYEILTSLGRRYERRYVGG